jgi:hypothetical protein
MKIFVEGGGDSTQLKAKCREAFAQLLGNVLPASCKLKLQVVACGARHIAFDKFRLALESGDTDVALLVDAEDVITNLDPATQQTLDPWQHLVHRGETWHRPARARHEQIHLMAVSMETWLVADRARLGAYYGKDFQPGALPTHAQLETVAKPALNNSLTQATRRTTKGEYSKGSHSFAILATLDPAELERRLPHAKRFFDFLRAHC